MSLFGGKPADGAAAWEPQARPAGWHTTAGAAPSGVFTSDLSVSEYVLLGEAGFEPFGFVVGFTGMGHGRVFGVVSDTGCS